eukprot:COSAG02_NODE_5556_length_4232_cov_3.634957_2_plen_85_part_00
MPAPGLWSYVGGSYIGVRHHVNSGNEERHEHHIGVDSVLMSMHVFAVLWMMNRMQVNAGERIRTLRNAWNYVVYEWLNTTCCFS